MLAHPNANALVLHGQRRIGKTSILLQLRRLLRATGEYTPIYLDLQDKAALPLDELLFRLAQEIAEAMGSAPPEHHRFNDDGTFFRKEFLPSISSVAPLVLLFDEFDVLDSAPRQAGQSFFPYLRRWMAEIERVKFVFVLGRRPEDLSTETLSTFKGVIASRVSFLDKAEAEAVIRQSETHNDLRWSDSAVERVWKIAKGHPYFTQLLGSVSWDIWDRLRREDVEVPNPIEPELVEAAVPQALQQGAHSFLWIWNGLPPAERVVLAALAQAKEDSVSRDELVDILNSSGVRLIVRELEMAPETLVEWGILIPVGETYSFAVPIFRRWLASSLPLRRVKDELDRLNPLAENLFAAAQHLYQLDLPSEAKSKLNEALRFNPNHLRSRLLLGKVLLEEGDISGAVTILEEAFQIDYTARPEYVQALLASADGATEDEQIEIYGKIISVEPRQRIANERLLKIQEKRRRREILRLQELASNCEKDDDWEGAVKHYYLIRQIGPEHPDLEKKILDAERQVALALSYREAVSALERGDKETATFLLGRIIAKEPEYKEAARYLLLATKRIDIKQVEAELDFLVQQLRAAEGKIVSLEAQVNSMGIDLEKNESLKFELAATTNRLMQMEGEVARLEHQRNGIDFMERFRVVFGSGNPEALISCPICGVQVKGKNLLRHYIQRHSEGEEKSA